jgi:hypothetical protein
MRDHALNVILTLRGRPLLAITLLAAALRLPTLALESLWYDETFTAWLAGLPLANLWAATMGDVHPPTWYLIEWAVVHALGNGEFALRLVSGLAGVGLVPAVWRLATILDLPQEAAALVTALAPFAVYYSQEARPYSLLMLSTTLATIGLLERRWWVLVLGSVVALYLHNLAVLYICGLLWLGLYRWRLEWRMWGSFLLIGMIWLPWVIVGLLEQAADVQNSFWVRPPDLATPAFILVSLFFAQAGFIAINAGVLSGLVLLLADWRRQIELTGLVVVTLSLAVILSVLVAPVLIVRVMAPLAPVLYALVAPVLSRHRLIAALGLATAVTWLGAYWLSPNVGRPPHDLENFHMETGDGIYHGNLASYITMRYYWPDVRQVVWRQGNDLSQSLTDQTKAAMLMEQADFEAVKCQRPRWWIVTASNPTTAPAERAYISNLLAAYDGEQQVVIKQSDLVDARLWLVDTRAVCMQAEARR